MLVKYWHLSDIVSYRSALGDCQQIGWQETHIFQAPFSSERFKANVVSAMQKRKIIGVTSLGGYDICSSRYVIISREK